MKLPFNEEATMNKCTKYEQVMLKIYKKAIQLAIEDREHHSDEKVSYRNISLKQYTYEIMNNILGN